MSTALIYTPTTDRPVRFVRRTDLVWQLMTFRGKRFWAVKDPVALRYFQLGDEEHYVVDLLDGQRSFAEILQSFDRRFAPTRLRPHQLQAFLATLHEKGIVIAAAPGQGEELLVRHHQNERKKWMKAFAMILAFKFRGFDPERFLQVLFRCTRWMFQTWFVVACLLLVLGAATWAAVQADSLLARLPERDTFFSASNIVFLMLTLSAVKILHEFGHALTLKRFGGECHTMGFMLLAFSPTLYCDVSDAWMLPNKWHRIAVSSAGMAVELVLASMATFLWWFSEPGLFHALCLNVIVVCSVSTLVFNANPLLRFDGYYIFFDLVEVPNLRQDAFEALGQTFKEWLFGPPHEVEELSQGRNRALLCTFAVASIAYRIVIVASIVWMMHRALEPKGLVRVANLMGTLVVAGLVLSPVTRAARMLTDPVGSRDRDWGRASARLAIVALALIALLTIPLPHRVWAPVTLEPLDAQRIYVSAPGTVAEHVELGANVRAGQTIARLNNGEIQLDVERLTGQRDRQKLHVANLERQEVQNREAENVLPAEREKLADIEERLKRRQTDLDDLTLLTPVGGVVLPPPYRPEVTRGEELSNWFGTPLDAENRNCFVETGTLLCRIGDPEELSAVLSVDESQIEFVRAGHRVRIKLDQYPGTVLEGIVTEIAEVESRQRQGIGTAADAEQSENGRSEQPQTTYLARVKLDPSDEHPRINATGWGKIAVAPMSLGQRLRRFLNRTFRLDL